MAVISGTSKRTYITALNARTGKAKGCTLHGVDAVQALDGLRQLAQEKGWVFISKTQRRKSRRRSVA